MLSSLFIKNYAIIEELSINFNKGLNIITGETGAGKSILLGALNLILGQRADSNVLRDKQSKCIVEGNFNVEALKLKTFFKTHDLDYEPQTIIRREIRPDGKSRAFVNDSPVKLDTLKQLTSFLVDLHAQHETQALLDKNFYLNVLDSLAKQQKVVSNYQKEFAVYQAKNKQLNDLKANFAAQKNDADYLQFQLQELEELHLNLAQDVHIEEELSLMENAETIQENLNAAIAIYNDGEVNILDLWRDMEHHVRKLASVSSNFEKISERMEQLNIELEDVFAELSSLNRESYVDESNLLQLQERHSAINRLMQKHQQPDVASLIQFESDLRDKLASIAVSDEDLAALEKEVEQMRNDLFEQAQIISKQRQGQVENFIQKTNTTLSKIGMLNAQVNFEHAKADADGLKSTGIDSFELLFSANKGSAPQSLKKVASGGERSRLMLAIKSLTAGQFQLPTLIFDEIDTGISGEVAAKVGEVFKQMAKNHQLITISHLPQIAARADQHLFVYKDDSEAITKSGIRILSKEEQVVEIAKMLSGDKPGEAALTTARELLN